MISYDMRMMLKNHLFPPAPWVSTTARLLPSSHLLLRLPPPTSLPSPFHHTRRTKRLFCFCKSNCNFFVRYFKDHLVLCCYCLKIWSVQFTSPSTMVFSLIFRESLILSPSWTNAVEMQLEVQFHWRKIQIGFGVGRNFSLRRHCSCTIYQCKHKY